MSDTPDGPGRRSFPIISSKHFAIFTLGLILAFYGFLYYQANVGSVVSANSQETAALPSSNSLPGLQNAAALGSGDASPSSTFLTGTLPYGSSDINGMLAQLQSMQDQLQQSSSLLNQKNQVQDGLRYSNPTPRPALTNDDISAMWAEVEQLNQVMQPLMVQLNAAIASQSSRSASELAALRTRVNAIHQRLAFLLQRIEIAKANGYSGVANTAVPISGSAPGVSSSSDLVPYQNLYQTLSDARVLLQQIQSQGALR